MDAGFLADVLEPWATIYLLTCISHQLEQAPGSALLAPMPVGLAHAAYCNKHNKEHKFVTSYDNGKKCPIKDCINCSTMNVVECSICKLQYVGCTTRPLRTRISELYNGAAHTNVNNLSNVSKNLKMTHSGNVNYFSVCAIQREKQSIHGGELHHKLLEHEVRWIFSLGTRISAGLNFRWDIDLFLQKIMLIALPINITPLGPSAFPSPYPPRTTLLHRVHS